MLKDEEMQERRRDDESCMDNGNVPELCCGARKHTDEDQTEEKSAESGCSDGPSWQPQESDCLPSVFMAAFLALVFVSVSMVLLCHGTVHFSLRDLKALSLNTAHLPKEDFQSLHLLFPNQPESTWRTILRSVCKSHLEEPWILVGIGPGDASRTLLCFTKMMLSLLTRQKSIGVELLDSTSPWLPPMGSSENKTWLISSVKVLWGEQSLPRGLVVTWQSLLDGKGEVAKNSFALLGDGVEQIREKFPLQRLIPSLISRILSLNHDGRPKKVMIDHEDYLVLFIISEPYLKSGLVC